MKEDIEIIELSKYGSLIQKINKKIKDVNMNINSVNKFIDNHLSGNTPLALYIIIECVANFPVAMSRGATLIRMIQKKHCYNFISSFCSALKNFRINNSEINFNVLLLLQTCFASYFMNLSETEQILNYYLNENELNYVPYIISEKYVIPEKTHNLQILKEKKFLEKQVTDLKEKIESSKLLSFEDDKETYIENSSNVFFTECQELYDKNKYSRRYSNMYKAVSSIAYIFGSKCYSFFRKYFPLPHETLLRKKISPIVQKYVNSLIDTDEIEKILNEFLPDSPSEKIHVTLAIDAAAFKEVKGETILEKFPSLKSINLQSLYNNLFVFYLQPFNINIKPFPIHINLKENGSASKEIVACIKNIISILEKHKIIVDYVATDGDHQYEKIHEEFFEMIFELYRSNLSFSEMIKVLSESKLIHIPISDFLHLLKIFRSNLVKYGIEIDHKCSVAVTPDSLQSFQLGKALTDKSTHGKMKDCYPLKIYSSKNNLKAINDKDWAFIFYSLPFNLMINSVCNPHLSHELRKYNLETCFYFVLHYLYQFKSSVSPPITRIGLIRMINSIVGISIALERYDFVQIGHIGTHPLENYFGCIRIACHNDHSYCNIFRAIGKAIYTRKILDELKQENIIRTRLGIGGAHAKIQCIEGIIPDFTPFQLFKMVWHKMKDDKADTTFFESWFSSYKTIEWEEEITQASKLSGSNVISRYLNLSNESKSINKAPKINMKCRKHKIFAKISKLKRIFIMTQKETDSLPIEDPLLFFIQNYSAINHNLEKEDFDDDEFEEKLNFHYKIGLRLLKRWTSVIK